MAQLVETDDDLYTLEVMATYNGPVIQMIGLDGGWVERHKLNPQQARQLAAELITAANFATGTARHEDDY